jgi:hypothetical protein
VIQREIENAGVATVSVSLVREFTEKVRPPRALWVPFPFGRPLGAPGNTKVQRQVIMKAFSLLSATRGPLIAEFTLDPEDEQLDAKYQTLGRKCGPTGCSLDDLLAGNVSADEAPREIPYGDNLQAVLDEIEALQPRHREYRDRRSGRTAVGASGCTPERIAEAARGIDAFIRGTPLSRFDEGPGRELPEPFFSRLLIDDLKSFYMEARIEISPEEGANAALANDWFWLDTWAGRMIIAARDRFVELTDREKDPNWIVARAIVPRGYGKSAYTLGHVVNED